MKSEILIVVSAIAVAGEIIPRGNPVEVSGAEARDLLNRGKCRRPTDEELAELLGATVDVAASGTVDPDLNPQIAAVNASNASDAVIDAATATDSAADVATADAATDVATTVEAPAAAAQEAAAAPAARRGRAKAAAA